METKLSAAFAVNANEIAADDEAQIKPRRAAKGLLAFKEMLAS